MARSATFLVSSLVDDPTSPLFYALVPLTHVTFYAVQVINLSYLQRMFPPNLRGVMNGLIGVITQLSSLMYYFICQYLANNCNDTAPLVGMCVSDLIGVVMVVVFARYFDYGKQVYKVQVPKNVVKDEENKP